jgi:hypothetical protein
MPSPIEPFMPYLNTFIFFAIYTTLYKNNPVYRFAQNLVVGAGAGYLIVAQVNAYQRGVLTQMFVNGQFNFNMLIPWIMGLAYLCIFVPRLINVYRAVSILTLTVGMGIVLPYGPALFWTNSIAYAQNALNIFKGFSVSSVGQLITAIAYVAALSYFFFTDYASKPTTTIRKGGRLVLLIYTAMTITTVALGKVNLVQWKVLDAIQGVPSTWFIPAILLVVMLIDHFYPLKQLISGSSKKVS